MYPSDLKDKEWEIIEPLLVSQNGWGNRQKHSPRVKMNAIFYVAKTGCQWRHLPHDFPPWSTVYTYFRRLSLNGKLQNILMLLNQKKRLYQGRNEHPSLMIIDSQSVKTQYRGTSRGFDGGKKIKGRKRQIAVDTQGNIHEVYVHSAKEHDSKAGCILLHCLLPYLSNVKAFYADKGYRGCFAAFAEQILNIKVYISKAASHCFTVIPRRWVVERTFAWLGDFRRLAKDFEINPIMSENMIRIAAISMVIRHLNYS